MSSHPDSFSVNGAWFSEDGADKDVVLFTRVRLARNLANFAFPASSRKEDADRVQALVFDAFSHTDNPERFQCVGFDQLEPNVRQLLAERGILPEKDFSKRNINVLSHDNVREFDCPPGIVVRTDGRISCLINANDHVRISAFASGFEPETSLRLCREIDCVMQTSLQFAASYDFGFLTAALQDTGSGMKISVWVFLPALMQLKKLKEISDFLSAQNCTISPALGSVAVPFGALGACYQLSSRFAFSGSEESQLTEFTASVGHVCSAERKARAEFHESKPTLLAHLVGRMLALARNSRFLECSEAVEIVSVLQFGLSCGMVAGISYSELHALIFRVRNAHVDFLYRSGNFMFESDIKDDINLIVPRLRALLVQEALEEVRICI